MQGMKFLVLGQDGRPLNHGVIAQPGGTDKHLCVFQRVPQFARLVHTDEIMGWMLFPSDEQLNAYVAQLNKELAPKKPATPAAPPAEAPAGLQLGPATQPENVQ